MLRKYLPFAILAFTLVVLTTSCKKKNTEGRYVPATAAVVVHFNGASINEKLSWQEIKQSSWFAELSADTTMPAFAKSALDDPENTGTDIKKDFLIFYVNDSAGAYMAVEGSIKDAAKFKAYHTASMKDATASEKDGINFLAGSKTTTAWNKDMFVMVSVLPANNPAAMQSWMDAMEKRMEGDSLAMPPAAVTTTFDGIPVATAILNLAEKNSLAVNEKFTDMVKTKGDVHAWINSEALYTNMPDMGPMAMVNFDKLLKGAATAVTASFEKGQIVADTKSYAGKEMTELWKKYSGKKISEDMVKRIPAKDIAVLMALNFKPEGIREFVKLMGLEGMLNMATPMLGFTMDDFVKANKGDLLFAMYDFAKDSNNAAKPALLFSTSINDKAAFEKLMAAGKKMGSNRMGPLSGKINFKTDGKIFAIGNAAANVDAFMAGNAKADMPFWSKINAAPMGGYVNIQYILGAVETATVKDSAATEAIKASRAVWKDIVYTGGDMSGNAMTQHVEINLVNKDVNSLKQLNDYLGTLAKFARAKKQEMQSRKNQVQDSTVLMAPIQ